MPTSGCCSTLAGQFDRSAGLARHLVALSAPRDGWLVRLAIGIKNRVRHLRGDPFRTFVHPWAAMDARLETLGFVRAGQASTLIWRIAIYRRSPPPTG